MATATKRRSKPAHSLLQLADAAHDAVHAPTLEARTAALRTLLAGFGILGRRVAVLLGLAPPPPKRVAGERPLPFRKLRAAK